MKTMKKYSILLGAAFSLFTLASCQKEVDVIIPENDNANKHIPFELKADVPETRTTIDAQTWEMAWDNNDVIYAVTTDEEWGAPYSQETPNLESIAEFTNGENGFSTESEITDGQHTFNFLYTAGNQKSYHRGAGSTFQLYSSQTMDANAPTANLKNYDALAGQVTATTPTTFVNVPMSHVFTLMKVTLKNKTQESINITKFEISVQNTNIAGVFDLTFGDTPTCSYNKNGGNSIAVNITNGEIAANGELPVYFVMAPLSNYSGDITFTATDSDGAEYTKTNTVSGVTFDAGKYNTASFSLKPVEKPIYSTSFDYEQVGTAYNSSTPIFGSDEDSFTSWEIVYGNWAGSNSAQLRVYSAGNYGYITNTFDCSGVTHVTYSAKVSNTALKLNTYYSTDKGASWTKVDDAKELTTSMTDYSFAVSETGEYGRVRIKFEVTGTKPSSSNYQLTIDDVKIWGNGTVLEDAVISAENITDVPVAGVENATANYTVNFTDDVKVTSTTGCVIAATAGEGIITYSVAPNYTTSVKTGTIVLASESDPVTTKTINVSQEASSGLAVSETTVTIPVDAQSATFTLTTVDFGWNSTVTPADGMNITINPTSGDASENAQTVTVTSTTDATESVQDLGTIVIYRNGNTGDSSKKTITIRKAASQASGTKTYTMTLDNHASGNNNVHWLSSTTSLDWDGISWTPSISWAKDSYYGTAKAFAQIGSAKNPATEVDITTSGFGGKKLKSVTVECYCTSSEGPTLSIIAGSTTMLDAMDLVKTTSTRMTTSVGDVTLSSSDNLTILFESSVGAGICIKEISVTYYE